MRQPIARCRSLVSCLAAALVLGGCGAGQGGSGSAPAEPRVDALDVAQPDGWDDDLALNVPVDMNPDPDILEIELEAKVADIEFIPGHETPAWTYGGTVPGPLIRAKVGDRVIIHFTNHLPEATSIHWHGLRVPNGMDGVPGVTQEPVLPESEFLYEFTVNDAGTYWYHPHINSAAQVGWGMYGPIVVEDPADPPEFGDDLVLMLTDIGLTGGSSTVSIRIMSTRGRLNMLEKPRSTGTHCSISVVPGSPAGVKTTSARSPGVTMTL